MLQHVPPILFVVENARILNTQATVFASLVRKGIVIPLMNGGETFVNIRQCAQLIQVIRVWL